MWWTEVPNGSPIFRQGDKGSCFFIIASGIVEVNVDGKNIKTLKSGEGFG
jgi:CRP-like cAMP-binding protein